MHTKVMLGITLLLSGIGCAQVDICAKITPNHEVRVNGVEATFDPESGYCATVAAAEQVPQSALIEVKENDEFRVYTGNRVTLTVSGFDSVANLTHLAQNGAREFTYIGDGKALVPEPANYDTNDRPTATPGAITTFTLMIAVAEEYCDNNILIGTDGALSSVPADWVKKTLDYGCSFTLKAPLDYLPGELRSTYILTTGIGGPYSFSVYVRGYGDEIYQDNNVNDPFIQFTQDERLETHLQ